MIEAPNFLPPAGKQMYTQTYKDSFARTQSDAVASEVAWGVVKRRLRKSDNVWVANNSDFLPPTLYEFSIVPEGDFLVQNTDDGEVYVEGVLVDDQEYDSGNILVGKVRYTTDELHRIADQINSGGAALPDVEHTVMNAIQKSHADPRTVIENIKNQKGLFKKIKAAVKDGKLWIQAWLDKRYKNVVNQYKGLSLEAVSKKRSDGTLYDTLFAGFTFTKQPRLGMHRTALTKVA